jgi:hypothetical protein
MEKEQNQAHGKAEDDYYCMYWDLGSVIVVADLPVGGRPI